MYSTVESGSKTDFTPVVPGGGASGVSTPYEFTGVSTLLVYSSSRGGSGRGSGGSLVIRCFAAG